MKGAMLDGGAGQARRMLWHQHGPRIVRAPSGHSPNTYLTKELTLRSRDVRLVRLQTQERDRMHEALSP